MMSKSNIERSWTTQQVGHLRDMLASYIENPRDVAALSRWIEDTFDPAQPRGAVTGVVAWLRSDEWQGDATWEHYARAIADAIERDYKPTDGGQ